MAICKDPNDPTQINASQIQPLTNDASADGFLLPSFVNTAFTNFSNSVSATNVTNNPIDRFVNDYGQDVFDAGLDAVNDYLTPPTATPPDLSEYQYLETRVNEGTPITTIEYAEYMVEFGQNPVTVVEFIDSNPTEVTNQLDNYYQNNFTQSTIGSFCALMPSVFAAIENFIGLASKAINWFESIEDLTLAGIIDSLYNQIKESVTAIIDKAIAKVKSIIDNIVADIQKYYRRIQSTIIRIKERIEYLISEENIQRIKDRIQNAIDYVLNIFQNPSLEEIQYLIYRFCSLAGELENAFDLLSQPLLDIVNSYDEILNTVTAVSNVSTADAVDAGAVRLTDEERAARINEDRDRRNENNPSGAPIEQKYFDLLATSFTWEYIKPDGIGGENYPIIITRDNNNSFGANSAGRRYQPANDGWDGINDDVRARFIKLQDLYSQRYGFTQFEVRSGYRSRELNDYLRSLSPDSGVVRNSLHISRIAIDFRWIGFSTTAMNERMIPLARECGFTDFGRYSSSRFLHIDTRGRGGSWGR